METLIDDVGSFPLPLNVEGKVFNDAYSLAKEAIINGQDIRENRFLLENFYQVVVDSFRKKVETGLDVVNYPQHYDMLRQLTDALHVAMSNGTYLVEKQHAILPEVHVLKEEAKVFCDETGEKLKLRVCILGPMELYLKEIGTVGYEDVLQTFADSVRRFVENSILDAKYIKTVAISLDEPSFGFQDISVERDVMLGTLERAFDFNGPAKQIHLHSPSRIADLLNVENIDVLSLEYAASPRNIDVVSKKMLDEVDKQIRVGISRTDINSIMAELYDRGVTKPSIEQMAETEEIIRKRFMFAKEKYGDRMTFTGPDCGLGGWPSQEAAVLVLKRTVNAVKSA